MNKPYYMTAYGLAVQQGFRGSLDEWLDSLHSYLHIKFAQAEPESDEDMQDEPAEWIGICNDKNREDPVHYTSYKWIYAKGETDYSVLADDYSTAKTYAVGDIVLHLEKVYSCTTAISVPEAWTPAHWEEQTIATAMIGKIGRMSMQVRGAWDEDESYEKLDLVTHRAGLFMAKGSTSGVEPGVDEDWQSDWDMVAAGVVSASASTSGSTVTLTLTMTDGTTKTVTFTITVGTVGTDDIEDGAVTAAKMADGAVTTGKIASNAVSTGKLAGDAVTAAKVAADAGTMTKLLGAGNMILSGYEYGSARPAHDPANVGRLFFQLLEEE